MCPLDLPHVRYHACINDCIIYRKEHAERKKPDDGDDPKLRHVKDGSRWRVLNSFYRYFGCDARNIVLGACTDGMNLFGNQNTKP